MNKCIEVCCGWNGYSTQDVEQRQELWLGDKGGVQSSHRKTIVQNTWQLTLSLKVCPHLSLCRHPPWLECLYYTLLSCLTLQCPPPSSQRPFLPTLPNTELFLLGVLLHSLSTTHLSSLWFSESFSIPS